ncbi:hypothetical protein CQW23_35807 [Capsicum baccatum]|uniref:Uncharacterized protein n=1 Tax=Capsicum baccatum TaxID=33114 RepID=A0A2G2UUQ2_CAPBA|nr:hypothetical protein CQW23_35807 [Capsicum baccatum]
MSPYELVYGKACHLPIELEHMALWALKKLNLNWDDAMNLRLEQLNELDEFRLHAYERTDLDGRQPIVLSFYRFIVLFSTCFAFDK